MLKTKYISRILLAFACMFIFVFQGMHTIEHTLSIKEYQSTHGTHEHFTQSRNDSSEFQWQEDHGYLDHCFVCDNMLSPLILSSTLELEQLKLEQILKKQQLDCERFTKLSHIYFSLRAPPSLG